MEILIIKLGAKGDVVRTLPLLIGIKQKYPDSKITWITKKSSEQIVKTSPYVNQVLTIPIELNKEFDIVYSLDIEEEATNIAEKIKAKKKLGFYNDSGFASAYNLSSEYYLNTLFDDDTKINNKKTYQQMMFDASEIPYNHEHHTIFLSDKDKIYASNFLEKNNLKNKKIIGIHIGSSPRWPSKAWHSNNIFEFINKAKSKGFEILLFSGPDEKEKIKELNLELEKENLKVYFNDPNNSDLEFVSLVNICSYMVCADSLALHVSLALKKPTICLFFCTSPYEVEDYRILKKIVSKKLYEFFPQKMDQYDEGLVKSISVDEVLNVISK